MSGLDGVLAAYIQTTKDNCPKLHKQVRLCRMAIVVSMELNGLEGRRIMNMTTSIDRADPF